MSATEFWQCKICHKCFLEAKQLGRHKREVHPTVYDELKRQHKEEKRRKRKQEKEEENEDLLQDKRRRKEVEKSSSSSSENEDDHDDAENSSDDQNESSSKSSSSVVSKEVDSDYDGDSSSGDEDNQYDGESGILGSQTSRQLQERSNGAYEIINTENKLRLKIRRSSSKGSTESNEENPESSATISPNNTNQNSDETELLCENKTTSQQQQLSVSPPAPSDKEESIDEELINSSKNNVDSSAVDTDVKDVLFTDENLQCRYCLKKFKEKRYRDDHERTFHTGETPFTCSFCTEKFSTRRQRRIHVIKHHQQAQLKRRKRIKKLRFSSPRKNTKKSSNVSQVSESKNLPDISTKNNAVKVETKQDKTDLLSTFTEGNRTKYRCNLCGKGFHSESNAKEHLPKHTHERNQKCHHPGCDRAYRYKRDLDRHISKDHPSNFKGEMNGDGNSSKKATIPSPVPPSETTTDTQERQESKTPTSPYAIKERKDRRLVYSCSECKQKFYVLSSIKEHFNKHTGNRPYVCTMCERAYRYRKNLAQHLKNHHQQTPGASIEAKVTRKQVAKSSAPKFQVRKKNIGTVLAERARRRSRGQPIKPLVKTSSYIVAQVFNDKKVYLCKFCKKIFEVQQSCARHVESCHIGKRWYCTLCTKSFTQQHTLNTHMSIHTKGPQAYQCEFCKRKFNYDSALRNHLTRKHAGPNVRPQTRIPKAKGTMRKPVKPMIIKTEGGTVSEEMSKPANVQQQSNKHLNYIKTFIKNNQKYHMCTICTKQFPKIYRCAVHVRMHIGDRPFKCPKEKCTSAFVTEADLRRHLRTVKHFVDRNQKRVGGEGLDSKETKDQNNVVEKKRRNVAVKSTSTVPAIMKRRQEQQQQELAEAASHYSAEEFDSTTTEFQCDICQKYLVTLLALKLHKLAIHRDKKPST